MSQVNYDSTFCGSLPIHLINLIQAYGVLLVIDREGENILQVSENAEKAFGLPARDIVNNPLTNFIDGESHASLKARLSKATDEKIPLTWNINNNSFLTLVHIKDKYLLTEIDLLSSNKREAEFVNVYQQIKNVMAAIETAPTAKEVFDIACKEIRRVSGFDKVMIYQFDREWNGTVVAEALEPGMEAYLGFTFPASDIPKQARLLYYKNPYRLIPKRDHTPVKLFPVINPITNSFLDLSDCNVRSVAAVHLEYLKNMNVMASMSTRILVDEALWGLIACHHRTEKNLSYEMCSVFEMLSTFISSRISALQQNENYQFETELKDQYTKVIEETYKNKNLAKSLFSSEADLLKLFKGCGAVVTYQGKTITKGEVPERDKVDELILWLNTQQIDGVLYADSLSQRFDQALDYKDIGSGIMVIPIKPEQDEYIIIFRPEVIRVINWGGNPDERIQFEEDQINYHPRNSFKQWQQKVSASSTSWRDEEVQTAEKLRNFIFDYVKN